MACNNNNLSNSFKIMGLVENAKDGEKIVLSYYTLQNEEWYKTVDTTEIINGKFVFTGHIDNLTAAYLVFDEPTNVVIDIQIYLEPTTMKLRINKSIPYAYILEGTKVEKESLELRKILDPYNRFYHDFLLQEDDLVTQIQQNEADSLLCDSLNHELFKLRDEFKRTVTTSFNLYETYLGFISKHKNYRIVPDLISALPVDTARSIFNSLPESSKTSLMGRLALKQLEKKENEQKSQANSLVGCFAPDFTREDAEGKTIRLSDFKDQSVVLLDFWASTCGPCIKKIPDIINLHDKYGNKGLVVIGISEDTDRADWLNAIEKFQLNQWSQILSIRDKTILFDNDVIGDLYAVQFIPSYILIDKQGKIAARWVGAIDEDLLQKLIR